MRRMGQRIDRIEAAMHELAASLAGCPACRGRACIVIPTFTKPHTPVPDVVFDASGHCRKCNTQALVVKLVVPGLECIIDAHTT